MGKKDKYKSYEYQGMANDDMVDFVEEHERPVWHMYKDHKGNVTVGTGFYMGSKEDAKKYEFYHMMGEGKYTNQRASIREIEDAYEKVKAKPHGQKFGAGVFNPFYDGNEDLPKIGLKREYMRQKTKEKLKEYEDGLKRKIPNFDELPYPAKKALMDMQYNIGDYKFRDRYKENGELKKGWPKLYEAIDMRDWKRAAKESHRRDVNTKRNKEVYDLFMEADEWER